MRTELVEKIRSAIKLLMLYDDRENPMEVAYSGGKDSEVILQLAKEAGVNFRAIYRNTTIDPPGTIQHVKEMGVEIVQPTMSFFDIIVKNGFPTRRARFCCRMLKEYKILDRCVVGVRREESLSRAKRYREPTQCRLYGSKKKSVEQLLPILDWTIRDVAEFLADREIKCAPVYYDEQNRFHPERRLGCMACPLSSNQLSQFEKYPNLVRAWLRAGLKWWNCANPEKGTRKKYKDIYEVFVMNVFFNSQNDFFNSVRGSFWGDFDCKAFLEEKFCINLE